MLIEHADRTNKVVFGRNKNNTAAMGSSQLPIACAGGALAGGIEGAVLLHCFQVRQRDDAAAAVYAGLYEEAEPVYGGLCGCGTGSVEWGAKRNRADGVVCEGEGEGCLED